MDILTLLIASAATHILAFVIGYMYSELRAELDSQKEML